MEKEKARVIKSYLKLKYHKDTVTRQVNLVKELPLDTLLVLDEHGGRSYVLKINFFRRKETSIFTDVYAFNLNQALPDKGTNRYLSQVSINLMSIKTWRPWTKRDALLTVNWSMSKWYKTLVFGE